MVPKALVIHRGLSRDKESKVLGMRTRMRDEGEGEG